MSQYQFNICLSKSNKLNFLCIFFFYCKLKYASSSTLLPEREKLWAKSKVHANYECIFMCQIKQ